MDFSPKRLKGGAEGKNIIRKIIFVFFTSEEFLLFYRINKSIMDGRS